MRKIHYHLQTWAVIVCSFIAVGCSHSQVSPGQSSAAALPVNLTSIPHQFHGVWTHESSGVHPREAELPMVVGARKLEGHEWGGDAVFVVSRGSNDITITVEGWAEGDPFRFQERWQLSEDGSSMRVTSLGDSAGSRTLYRARGWDRSQSAYGD